MADLDFPSSPVNGQTYTLNGVQYNYNASIGAWLTYLIQNPVTANTTNTQIYFNDAGNANGNPGLVFDKNANTAYFNQVNAAANVVAQFFIGNGSKLTGVVQTTVTSNSNSRIWANSVSSGGVTTVYLDLATSGVTATTYGGSTQIPVLTIDTYGRVTGAANVAVNGMDYPYVNTVASTAYAAAAMTVTSLSDASGTISWDASTSRMATVTLSGTGRTMDNPTNLKAGSYIFIVKQDATGSRTITTWGSVFKWPAAVAPTLSTTASTTDVFSFWCDGTNLYGTYIPDCR